MSVYVFVNNVNKLNWIFCKIIYHDRKQEKKDETRKKRWRKTDIRQKITQVQT